MTNLPKLADDLLPYLLPLLRVTSGVGVAGGGVNTVTTHALSGGSHTGILSDSQAPQFLKTDGSRALNGNLAVNAGITIDGVDLSAHAANPAAHHDPVTAGLLIALSNQQVSVAPGTAQYQIPVTGASPFNPAWTLISSFAGAGLAFSGGAFAVGVANTGADGLSVEADAVRLTSSSNPGATAAILASDANGYLSLVRLRTPLIDTVSGNLTLQPAGDITIDPVGNDVLPATNYDINLGALSKKYLTLHAAELWVETLVAQDTVATIGGRILVGPTTYLTRDIGTGDTQIYVRHNQMVSGDRAYMEADGKVEFLAITSGATAISGTEYRYNVTRNLDGTGANSWYAGDAVFNTGQAGNGFIDLYSLRGVKTASQAGPTIVGNMRNSATFNDWSEAWAIGNLNGLYGYGANTMGVGLGKYQAGQPNIVIDATNGVRLRQYNTDMIVLDAAGNSYFAGVMTIGAGGEIRQGTGTLGSTFTGLRLWRDSNVGRIGGYNNNTLQWYGDTVGNFVAGAGYVLLNANGIRQTAANVKSASTEPSLTPITPAINQRLSFYDSADSDDWGYTYPGGTDYDYFYPGMEWLRIYVSSQHFVQPQPYTTTITENYHVYDAVIDMPNNTFTTNAGTITQRRLLLRSTGGSIELQAPSIVLGNNQTNRTVIDSSNVYAPKVQCNTSGGWARQLLFENLYPGATMQASIGAFGGPTGSSRIYLTHATADPYNNMAGVHVLSSGNVGVGTNAPSATLDVNGRILAVTTGYDWSELTPQNNWANQGSPNATLGVKRFGTHVSIKGVVRAAAAIASLTAVNVQLASEYRPAAGRSFACVASIGGTETIRRVYVDSSGYIRPVGAFSTNDWIAIEVSYYTGG